MQVIVITQLQTTTHCQSKIANSLEKKLKLQIKRMCSSDWGVLREPPSGCVEYCNRCYRQHSGRRKWLADELVVLLAQVGYTITRKQHPVNKTNEALLC
jgi:hypothetical protein